MENDKSVQDKEQQESVFHFFLSLPTSRLNTCNYSETCLNRTPYIPETWTNGK